MSFASGYLYVGGRSLSLSQCSDPSAMYVCLWLRCKEKRSYGGNRLSKRASTLRFFASARRRARGAAVAALALLLVMLLLLLLRRCSHHSRPRKLRLSLHTYLSAPSHCHLFITVHFRHVTHFASSAARTQKEGV